MIYISRLQPHLAERKENLNVFSRLAASQYSCIHLVVARLQVPTIFRQKAESNLCPGGIFPMGSDKERDVGQALSFDWLDGEEQIVGDLALEVMDG